jgi:hypothetical protein
MSLLVQVAIKRPGSKNQLKIYIALHTDQVLARVLVLLVIKYKL